MKKAKNIDLRKRTIDIDIDFPLFCKYNQYNRFLAEVHLQYKLIKELPQIDKKQVVLYDLFDQDVISPKNSYDY